MYRQILRRSCPVTITEDIARDNLEFYSYFGWAVKDMQEQKQSDPNFETSILKFRILKHEVSEEYMVQHVPRILCLRNLGGMTIPHHALKPWGLFVLKLINSNFNTKLHGNNAAKFLDDVMELNKNSLFKLFQETAWCIIFDNTEVISADTVLLQTKIHSLFLNKIVHARIGAYMDIIRNEETSRCDIILHKII